MKHGIDLDSAGFPRASPKINAEKAAVILARSPSLRETEHLQHKYHSILILQAPFCLHFHISEITTYLTIDSVSQSNR